jgi:NADH/NAD ratio-sensing transcriptional regulator Rex
MLRALLVLLLLVVVVGIGLVATGILDVKQIQQAQAPAVTGGQAPAFDVDVNPIEVGTTTKNVTVPVVGTETRQVEVPTVGIGGGDGNSNSQ